MRSTILAGLFGMAMLGTASAEPLAGVIDEVRIGLHAHEAHYTLWPIFVHEYDYSQIEDFSFDVLFTSPDIDAFRWIGSPRPELGTTINAEGEDSMAHLGLTWQVPVFDTPVYLEGTFGAAMHNGYLTDAPEGRRNLGCRINFYERFGVGVNLSESATATVTYEHMSNADLCDANSGFSNVGLRLGWKF